MRGHSDSDRVAVLDGGYRPFVTGCVRAFFKRGRIRLVPVSSTTEQSAVVEGHSLSAERFVKFVSLSTLRSLLSPHKGSLP